MGFCSCKVLIILVCVGFVAVRLEKVSGLSSADLVLRGSQEHAAVREKLRVLEAAVVEDPNTQKNTAAMPPRLDPNQSSKRTVRKGSDPIHNRC